MIRRALAVLILGPLAVLIVALAVANRQTVAISFDPFNAADPAYRVQLPLFLLVFLLVIAAKQSRWRRRSRRFEAQLHRAEAEIGRLRRRVGGATGDAAASPGQAEGGAAVAERPVDTRPPPQWPPPRALPPAA